MAKQSKFDEFSSKNSLIQPMDTDSKHQKWESERVLIRLLMDTRMIIEVPGGERYVFSGAGAEVKVDKADAEYLLAQRRGSSCCGGQSFGAIFEKV